MVYRRCLSSRRFGSRPGMILDITQRWFFLGWGNGGGCGGDKLCKILWLKRLGWKSNFVLGRPLQTLLIARTFEPFLGTVPASWFRFIAS